MSDKKPRGYWQNYDNCYNEAKKYNTLKEFEKHCVKGYKWSVVNGWLKDFDWLQRVKLFPNGYWQSYDNCFNEAKKYTKFRDFAKTSASAYNSARENGWLKDYTWLEKVKQNRTKPNGYWTYENCYKEALNCTTKTEFRNNCRGGYNVAVRNKWISDYTWFKRHLHCDDDYEVYAYEDRENKVVYVGLTYRLLGNGGQNRHNEHKLKDDPVGKYYDGKIPMPRRLMRELTPEDAQYYEDWYKKAYADNGWTLLNKAKTGIGSSSLGGVNIVWDYDSCYGEAQKYEKAARFKDGNPSAYRVAATNGWIREWFPDMKMPNRYWTYEKCKEEAHKYITRRDFSHNSKKAYETSCRNGWLKDFDWLSAQMGGCTIKKPRKSIIVVWTQEKCYEAAKQCTTLSEFYETYKYAYAKANRNGWLDNYFWLDRSCKPNGYWNYDTCFVLAKKCKSRGEFKEVNMTAYTKARKNGWLNDWFSSNIRKPRGYWDYEHCREEASNYRSRKELQEANKSVYNVCVKNKWLNDFYPIVA